MRAKRANDLFKMLVTLSALLGDPREEVYEHPGFYSPEAPRIFASRASLPPHSRVKSDRAPYKAGSSKTSREGNRPRQSATQGGTSAKR
jgi:hypothetical protein